MRTLAPLALSALFAAASTPAAAQLVVHDPTNYSSLIQQATTALNQLNELKSQVSEAKRLYEGFNTASGAGALAKVLDAPQLRAFIPDVDAYVAAARGDLARLGALGRKAAEVRSAARLYTPEPDDMLGQELERAGDRTARDLALGQAVASAGATRLEGLRELAAALDEAPNARAVMDLQARIAAEQAMTANDHMRLQGLAMAQDAEARLDLQRARERSAAARAARMARYRAGFQ